MDFLNGLNQLNGKWGQKVALRLRKQSWKQFTKLEGKVGGASLNSR